MTVLIKRAYDVASKEDGYRVLVDRLWPRGIKKEHAKIDLWLKEVAPSADLRKWFNHDVEKWPEFKTRYCLELKQQSSALEQLQAIAGDKTLVFAAKDIEHNNAVVLKQILDGDIAL